MANVYEIDLASLKEGKEYDYDFHIGGDFFESRENSQITGADVDVHLNIEKRHDAYMLEFDFAGDLEAPCDRCLDPVTVPIDTTYDILVRHGEEFDDSRDDLLIIPDNRNELDVSGIIYDTLLLEIPIRCVHAEGGCNAEMESRLREHGRDTE